MRVRFIGAATLTNTVEADDFIKFREPVYDYLYVCSPEFYEDNGKRYYKVNVRMYMRINDGRRLEANRPGDAG